MKRFETDPKPPRPDVIRVLVSGEMQATLKGADVILAVDEKDKRDILLFGRSTLAGIVKSGAPMKIRMVRYAIRPETAELEAMIVAVRRAKGYHEYEASVSRS